MMEWHYNLLKKYQYGVLASDREGKDTAVYFEKYGVEESCIGDLRCKYGVTRAYIDAIWNTRKIDVAKAILLSWGKLFFAGGASQLSRYLGLSTPDTYRYLWKYNSVTHDIRHMLDNWARNITFWVLFLITTSYTVICRAVGLIGILVMIRDRATLRYTFLHVGTIAIFLAMYLFSGISRFRAPLEPALALFFAIGIGVLFKRHNRVKEKTTQQFDHPRAEDGND